MDDMYKFGSKFSQTYKSECDTCGKEICVSTQKDEYPEYHTEVYVQCICGGSAKFVLPVN